MRRSLYLIIFISFLIVSAVTVGKQTVNPVNGDSITLPFAQTEAVIPAATKVTVDTIAIEKPTGQPVTIDPGQFVAYAETLIGTPYVYGSTDPAVGFDCSGFINHVAHHFNLQVPRSSVEFSNFGEDVIVPNAKAGDLILFTGTDAGNKTVGHIGIVTANPDGQLEFIHSSSGKARGVTVSSLEGYYEKRFVKVIRILREANRLNA